MISGKRCAQKIVEFIFVSCGTVGGAYLGLIGGGTIGAGIGTLLGGPVGSIFGSIIGEAIGGVVGGITGTKLGQALSDWLRKHFFDLPKDKAVENAYLFMDLHHECFNQDINKRYKELCLKYHPDKGGKVEDFQKLQSAMAIIRLSRGFTHQKQEQDDEHKHKKVKLNVLYFNARSINVGNEDKLKFLKRRIESLKPNIVAITETWLKKDFDGALASRLSLQDYTIYQCNRQDRNDNGELRKGGGILIAVKMSPNLQHTLTHHYKDNYMCLEFEYVFNCQKCSNDTYSTKFSFCLVYRRGNLYKSQKLDEFKREDDILLENLSQIATNVISPLSLFVGDFNFRIECDTSQKTWVNTWLSLPTTIKNIITGRPTYEGINQDYKIEKQKNFFESMHGKGYRQLVQDATIGNGNILDLIFARPGSLVDGTIQNLGHIPSEVKTKNDNEEEEEEIEVKGANLDHVMLHFWLDMGKNDCNKQIFL